MTDAGPALVSCAGETPPLLDATPFVLARKTAPVQKAAAGVGYLTARRSAIPVEACHLGWQESLALLAQLVEPEINQ